MGVKCFKSEEPATVDMPYPKFSYMNTEAGVLIKFINPSNMITKTIHLNLDRRIPADALICKIAPDYYFITGGLYLASFTRVSTSFELRFNREADEEQIVSKVQCPYIPYGGTLYLYCTQIYLVGYMQDPNLGHQNEIDPDKAPEPFRSKDRLPLLLNKNLRPGPVLRYSILGDK